MTFTNSLNNGRAHNYVVKNKLMEGRSKKEYRVGFKEQKSFNYKHCLSLILSIEFKNKLFIKTNASV
jgi:hypothetical protein